MVSTTDESASTEKCTHSQTYVEKYGCIDICGITVELTCYVGDVCVHDPRDNCIPNNSYATEFDCAGYFIPAKTTTFGPISSNANTFETFMISAAIMCLYGCNPFQ